MKFRLKYLVLILFFSVFLMAEEDEDSLAALGRGAIPSLYNFSMGTGLHLIDSQLGWAAQFGVNRKWSDQIPLLIGAEVGMTFWNVRNPNFPFFSNIQDLRFLVVVYYKWTMDAFPWLHPYAGFTTGVDYFAGTGTLNPSWRPELRGIVGEFALRFGLQVDLSDSLFLSFEPNIGYAGGQLFMNPLLSASLFL